MGAHKCPKCNIPIEKNAGCSHMTCSSCSHRWCWVCGLPLNHWSHRMSDVMPLSCKRVPSSALGWICQFILYIIGLIFLPIFIFGVGVFGTIYGCFNCICRHHSIKYSCRTYGSKCCCIIKNVFLIIPFTILVFALGLALGVVAGALGVALLTIPAYIFHTFYFVRSCYWWCKTSRIKD